MQKLSNSIREVVEGKALDTPKHLRETAKQWACWVLESNKDEELELGLKISKAICDYLNEIEDIYKGA